MPATNCLAILVAAVAAFVVTSLWYIAFNKQRMELLDVNADVRTTRRDRLPGRCSSNSYGALSSPRCSPDWPRNSRSRTGDTSDRSGAATF